MLRLVLGYERLALAAGAVPLDDLSFAKKEEKR